MQLNLNWAYIASSTMDNVRRSIRVLQGARVRIKPWEMYDGREGRRLLSGDNTHNRRQTVAGGGRTTWEGRGAGLRQSQQGEEGGGSPRWSEQKPATTILTARREGITATRAARCGKRTALRGAWLGSHLGETNEGGDDLDGATSS